jgi:hypothetical protein
MDIEIGTVLDIRQSKMFPAVSVTVVGIRVFVDGDTIRCIVTIADDEGNESTVGAFHLARWVEMAAE